MKRCAVFLILVCATFLCNAQTLAEWFNQKATQKKYLLQQIAALQVYIGYLQKGYSIAKNGLTTIGNIKNGHFSLDKNFFAGLENINPKVKNFARVADIISLNIKLVKQYKQTLATAKESHGFNDNEIAYMEKVLTSLIDGGTAITDELIDLITKGKLKMSDDARIRRIDGLYQDMQERYVFANSFSNDAGILGLQRKQEQKDISVLGTLYDHK